MHRALLVIICIFATAATHAQELAYRQWTVKDGLPGAIVYHCLQDRKGFIWFATNQGVTRFDGRTFHTYTKEDGLPDNEILQLYLDRHDNIWFLSFVGIPSVMYHDSIIRFDNCPRAKGFIEDQRTDSILFTSYDQVTELTGYYRSPNIPGRWKFTSDLRPRVLYNTQLAILRASTPGKTNFYFSNSSTSNGGSLLVQNSHAKSRFHFPTIHRHDDPVISTQHFIGLLPDSNAIVFFTYDSAWYASMSQISSLFSLHALGLNVGGVNSYVNNIYCENDSTLWLCARNQGLLRIRNFRTRHATVTHFFPRSNCTSIMKDREGGYWVTTFSDGVFYLPNLCFSTIPGPPDLSVSSVRSLHVLDDHRLVAGFDDGNIMEFDRNTWRYRLFPHWAANNKNNRIMDVRPYLHHSLLVAADMGLHRLFPDDTHTLLQHNAHKELLIRPDHTIVAAFSTGVFFFDTSGRQVNQIVPERATCITGLGDNIYWGTLHGVYALLNGRVTPLGQSIPALSGIINHIDVAPDSTLWVSTQDGIVIWKAGSVHRIGRAQNLASDLCKQVSFDGNTAWVATDKGISRIGYYWQDTVLRYSIFNITEEDGLRANDVNRTVIAGGYVWAGTARGICSFPETYTGRSLTPPGIVVTRILADGRPVDVADSLMINYSSGKLLIEMAGISYRSGSHVGYEYRLEEADSNWNRLAGNTLEFPTLPFGRFVLELRSIDRWNNRSNPIAIPIVHPSPFYRSAAFLVVTYALIVLLTAAGFYLYFRRRQNKREKEFQLRKKMHDLELSALRAQMNPHFIFNCLTSIQYHVLRADTVNANSFLHKFSNLIRLTLNYSSSPFISLNEEIKMLNLYLELEKLRLGHRMNYQLISPQQVETEGLFIPPMIIQPYVENAVQHGIAPLEDRIGELSVEFRLSARYLHCTIEDNGQGIDHSHARKQSTGHISQGSGITARRIRTINSIYKQQIILEILDKKSAGLPGSGTIVNLSFPLNID
ncbi:sensor histidine kinase [Puia dinghuensis]|nr:histidine kinase [Puia dinghuensis]